MLLNIGLLVAGLVTLIVGGEFLVRGAVGIAKKAKISTLVIGMTVVSFGTSAPELLVSLQAAMGGHPDIAIGNVIGSNISNLGLVLALTIIIFPIIIERDTLRIDWPMMLLASGLFFFFILDGVVQQWEGVAMLVILIVFTTWLVIRSRRQSQENDFHEKASREKVGSWSSVGFLGIGLIGLFFGAGWLLDGAVGIAKSAGMEERVIAITIVAFGTSVPELVTSCVAAFRKQTEISVGNLIGSNIFNILVVLGATGSITPINVGSDILNWDIYWLLGIAVLLLPLMLIGKTMGRIHGVVLLSSYLTYILLVLQSS